MGVVMGWIDLVNQLATLETIQAADAAERGYPAKGTPTGPGYHAPIGDTPGPGWTINVAPIERHPVNPVRYGYPTRAGLYEKLAGLLPPQALAAIAAAFEEKDASWIVEPE
jgi:hypothetical protein